MDMFELRVVNQISVLNSKGMDDEDLLAGAVSTPEK